MSQHRSSDHYALAVKFELRKYIYVMVYIRMCLAYIYSHVIRARIEGIWGYTKYTDNIF